MADLLVSRRGVSTMDRLDLEEKYIETTQENQLLKKHAKAQEEKMKKLATKLLKLSSDEKRELCLKKGLVKGVTDQSEEIIIELQEKIRELEKHKANLLGKVSILRQQLDSKGKKHTLYDRVPPKINSGISKGRKKSFSTEDISATKRQNVSTQVSPGPMRYGRSLLEDARQDNQELEELVIVLKREVGSLQEDTEYRKEQSKILQLKHEEEMLKLKNEIQSLKSASQKVNLEDDIERIKIKRDLQITTINLQTIEVQYSTIEKNYESVKMNRDKLMEEMKILNTQLKQEQNRSSILNNQLSNTLSTVKDAAELQQLVSDLKMERDILKQSNDRLMKSALTVPIQYSMPPLSSTSIGQTSLQLTNRLLEEKVKEMETKLNEGTDIHRKTVQQLHTEIKLKEVLTKELDTMRSQLIDKETEINTIKQRLIQYCQGTIDWNRIETALTQYKTEKPIELKEDTLMIPSIQTECIGKCQEEVQELQLALVETTNELNKSLRLLSLQNTISQDHKREMEAVKIRMKQMTEENDNKMEEYTQLLEMRSQRIKKLESQLKDITYNPRKSNIDNHSIESVIRQNNDESIIELSAGQNLLQLYVKQVNLSSEAINSISTTPSLFLCISLIGHQTHVTHVEHSINPVFGFTVNYITIMNRQLLTESIKVELYQSFGMKYELLGISSLPLSSLGGTSSDTHPISIPITGSGSLANVGSLDYWIRLQIPITQSDYEEGSENNTRPLYTGSDVYDNELIISIIKCTNLPLSAQGQPPMPYVMYKFYNYPDHDTPTLHPTLSPEFNNVHVYGITEGNSLKQYLLQNALEVYVFDDRDPNDNNYIGVAKIPLYILANSNSNIKGTYPLYSGSGNSTGQITLSITRGGSSCNKQKLIETSPRNNRQEPHPITAEKEPHPKTSNQEPHPRTSNQKPNPRTSNQKPHPKTSNQEPHPRTSNQEPHPRTSNQEPHPRTSNQEPHPRTNNQEPQFRTSNNTSHSKTSIQLSDISSLSPINDNEDQLPLTTEQLIEDDNRNEDSNTEDTISDKIVNEKNQQNENESRNEDQNGSLYASLTPTEEIDEEIEEFTGVTDEEEFTGVTDEEDALFEETTHVSTDLIHSKPVIIMEEYKETESVNGDSLNLTSDDESTTNTQKATDQGVTQGVTDQGVTQGVTDQGVTQGVTANVSKQSIKPLTVQFSLTVLSFTLEEASGVSSINPPVDQIFIEYQFLDFDSSELETPTSQPLPLPGQTTIFNFTNEFIINNDVNNITTQLLTAMLNSTSPIERRIPFTVVSDPIDMHNDVDCQEIGLAELNIIEVLQAEKEHTVIDIDVHNIEDSSDIIGYLTISMDGLHSLRQLVTAEL